jgi:hypothetical protein
MGEVAMKAGDHPLFSRVNMNVRREGHDAYRKRVAGQVWWPVQVRQGLHASKLFRQVVPLQLLSV